MRRLKLFFAILMLLPLVAANAAPLTENVRAFARLHLAGSGQVIVEQTPHLQNWQVIVTQGEPATVSFESIDGVLYVELNDAFVTVQAPQLREIVSSGAVQVVADSIHSDQLLLEGAQSAVFSIDQLSATDLVIHGRDASEFRLAGSVAHQLVDLSGPARYRAQRLASDVLHISLRDGGDASVWVEQLLDVNVGLGTTLRYIGTPQVSQTVMTPARRSARARNSGLTPVAHPDTARLYPSHITH